MPIFKTTANIFVDNKEYFDPNWMDSDTLILPPSPRWDNSKPLQIEDIDIWEVIAETGRGSLYAAWSPYAHFYMIVPPKNRNLGWGFASPEFYDSHTRVLQRIKELKIPYNLSPVWVEDEEIVFYQ